MIDFRVRHQANKRVVLDCFYVTGHQTDEPKKYYDTIVELDINEYAKQVLSFSEKALCFLPKAKQGDEWEVDIYKLWKTELEILIQMTKKYIEEGEISPEERERATQFDLSTGGKI